ncbi:unnamed protein product [Meloidogyne enterolobii]|uniref:Uncharacterized protein n=1 Tax=Meloidogyne enterolobii TaxID=390850 RepID=A0ACB0Y7L5_MELEN
MSLHDQQVLEKFESNKQTRQELNELYGKNFLETRELYKNSEQIKDLKSRQDYVNTLHGYTRDLRKTYGTILELNEKQKQLNEKLDKAKKNGNHKDINRQMYQHLLRQVEDKKRAQLSKSQAIIENEALIQPHNLATNVHGNSIYELNHFGVGLFHQPAYNDVPSIHPNHETGSYFGNNHGNKQKGLKHPYGDYSTRNHGGGPSHH